MVLTSDPKYASNLPYLQFGTATGSKSKSGHRVLLPELLPVASILGALWAFTRDKMGASPKLNVEGSQQVQDALKEVADKAKDLSEAHRAEANMLLADITSLTRWSSGDLAQGWEAGSRADAAEFTNRMVYAGVQEFGWSAHNIEPTLAVSQAFDSNRARTEQIYNDAIEKLAKSANIETR